MDRFSGATASSSRAREGALTRVWTPRRRAPAPMAGRAPRPRLDGASRTASVGALPGRASTSSIVEAVRQEMQVSIDQARRCEAPAQIDDWCRLDQRREIVVGPRGQHAPPRAPRLRRSLPATAPDDPVTQDRLGVHAIRSPSLPAETLRRRHRRWPAFFLRPGWRIVIATSQPSSGIHCSPWRSAHVDAMKAFLDDTMSFDKADMRIHRQILCLSHIVRAAARAADFFRARRIRRRPPIA